jgi:quinolinate synthase
VGTELNLVNRIAREAAPEREVVSLDDCFCVCSTMFRIDPPHLLWALEGLLEGQVRNQVKVPERIVTGARTALDRMLAIR